MENIHKGDFFNWPIFLFSYLNCVVGRRMVLNFGKGELHMGIVKIKD